MAKVFVSMSEYAKFAGGEKNLILLFRQQEDIIFSGRNSDSRKNRLWYNCPPASYIPCKEDKLRAGYFVFVYLDLSREKKELSINDFAEALNEAFPRRCVYALKTSKYRFMGIVPRWADPRMGLPAITDRKGEKSRIKKTILEYVTHV